MLAIHWKRSLVTVLPSYAKNFLLAAVNDYAGRSITVDADLS